MRRPDPRRESPERRLDPSWKRDTRQCRQMPPTTRATPHVGLDVASVGYMSQAYIGLVLYAMMGIVEVFRKNMRKLGKRLVSSAECVKETKESRRRNICVYYHCII